MDRSRGRKRKRDEPFLRRDRQKRPKKFKRAGSYHSSSEDEQPAQPAKPAKPVAASAAIDGGKKAIAKTRPDKVDKKKAEDDEALVSEEEEEENDQSSDSDNASASTATRALRKRNDPSAFAASISAILGAKLSTTKRADPVLSRSAAVAASSKLAAEDKLEEKAKRKIKADRHQAREKGHVTDVLGLGQAGDLGQPDTPSTGAVLEKENQLRRTAQRGVIKLFNAVRAAQTAGLEAERQAHDAGHVGIDSRKEKVTEMSKKGFLDLLVES